MKRVCLGLILLSNLYAYSSNNASSYNLINLQQAYNKGYTGAGIAIGIYDTFVDYRHSVFRNKLLGTNTLIGGGAFDNHGTHVAGIALGGYGANGFHGIAYNAKLYAAEAKLGGVTGRDNPNAYNFFANSSAKIINNSWGANVFPVLNKWEYPDLASYYAPYYDGTYRDVSTTARVMSLVKNYDKVAVFASGNEGQISGQMSAAMRRYDPSLGGLISVIALNADGINSAGISTNGLASFTNLAKGLEIYSISAPGVNIYSAYPNGAYAYASGTSMAAPVVSGSLALVQEAFPFLNARQLVDTILSTANKSMNTANSFTLEKEDNGQKRKVTIYVCNDSFSSCNNRSVENYYYYLTKEQIFGQGVLDVGKAVNGLSELNVNRMMSDSLGGLSGDFAMYKIDTQGFSGEFSNDIKEVKWDDKYHLLGQAGNKITNDNKAALQGKSAGLEKSGEGTLILSGNNTYFGDTIISGGILDISKRVGSDGRNGSGGILNNSSVFITHGMLTGNGEIKHKITNQNGIFAPKNMTASQYIQQNGIFRIYFDNTNINKLILSQNGSANFSGGKLEFSSLNSKEKLKTEIKLSQIIINGKLDSNLTASNGFDFKKNAFVLQDSIFYTKSLSTSDIMNGENRDILYAIDSSFNPSAYNKVSTRKSQAGLANFIVANYKTLESSALNPILNNIENMNSTSQIESAISQLSPASYSQKIDSSLQNSLKSHNNAIASMLGNEKNINRGFSLINNGTRTLSRQSSRKARSINERQVRTASANSTRQIRTASASPTRQVRAKNVIYRTGVIEIQKQPEMNKKMKNLSGSVEFLGGYEYTNFKNDVSYNSYIGGVRANINYHLTNSVFGVELAYNYINQNANELNATSDINAFGASLYGKAQSDWGLFGLGAIGGGSEMIATKRNTNNSKYNVPNISALLGIGYDIAFGGFSFGPLFWGDYVGIFMPEISENGSITSLKINKQAHHNARINAALYAKAKGDFGASELIFEILGGYGYNVLNNIVVDASFSSAQNAGSFQTQLVSSKHQGIFNLALSLNYEYFISQIALNSTFGDAGNNISAKLSLGARF